MRTFLVPGPMAAALLFAACAPEAPEAAPEVVAATPAAATAGPEAVGGWRVDAAANALIGEPMPAFRTSLHGGGEIGSEELRGRWTILVFWGLWSEDSLADFPYIKALSSAAEQDSDLDVLAIHTPPGFGKTEGALGAYLSLDQGLAERGGGWKTAVDADGSMAANFRVTQAPQYLLIGPDLTVVGQHGALSDSPEQSIKPLIRGVAELRKRSAAEPG